MNTCMKGSSPWANTSVSFSFNALSQPHPRLHWDTPSLVRVWQTVCLKENAQWANSLGFKLVIEIASGYSITRSIQAEMSLKAKMKHKAKKELSLLVRKVIVPVYITTI